MAGEGEAIDVEVTEDSGEVKTISMPEGSSAGDLLEHMELLREEYVILVDGRVVYEFEPLARGNKVRLIRAFSGG